jgi:alkaline phosphatase D
MIREDERRAPADRLTFVLHLGDFVYEIVWYPEDRPQGYYARHIRDIVRYPAGEKHNDFHVPTTVDDYRALYRAYLLDPDLQDARARWPFVPVPDNHEFSWKGWQSQESFASTLPAQTRKVAANQAWFEYQPARVVMPGQPNADEFHAPKVADAPLRELDDQGLGLEAGNLAAIRSLRYYRSLRLGANAELILTDNRSFRSEPLTTRAEAAPFRPTGFPAVVSEDMTEVLDAGAAAPNARSADTIRFGGADLPTPRRTAPPLSMLGATQKTWFLDRLRASPTPWKLWGNSVGSLDWRTDFQNLPDGAGPRWPTTGYALFSDDDWSGYRQERAEIFDFVERSGITGLATVCGDRHAFLARVRIERPPHGARHLAMQRGDGVRPMRHLQRDGIWLARDNPLRPVYVHQPANGGAAEPAINLAMMHGVRSSLELQRTGDRVRRSR